MRNCCGIRAGNLSLVIRQRHVFLLYLEPYVFALKIPLTIKQVHFGKGSAILSKNERFLLYWDISNNLAELNNETKFSSK